MIVIKTNNLSKQFRVYEKPAGLIGSFKSLFNNKFKDIVSSLINARVASPARFKW